VARHFREAEGLSITQIADRLGRSPATIKAYSMPPPGRRRGRSRRATRVSVAVAAPTPSRATARATRTRTARPATPALPNGDGPVSACLMRCASGARSTVGCPRRMTGRARTHAGAREMRSSASSKDDGRRRASSAVTSELGPPPARRLYRMTERRPRLRGDATSSASGRIAGGATFGRGDAAIGIPVRGRCRHPRGDRPHGGLPTASIECDPAGCR